MTHTVNPTARPLAGRLTVPGDKSISHRALLFGAIALGGLEVTGSSNGADVQSTRACLGALGVSFVSRADGALLVGSERGVEAWRAPAVDLDCGNSGTTMRLLMGLLAGQPFSCRLVGDASLSRRPMKRVAEPLRQMGAHVELSASGGAPLVVGGGGPLHGITYALPIGSAQVKSAVLLAGLFAEGETRVVDPFGSRDHTERFLRWLAPAGAFRWEGDAASVRGGVHLQGGRALHVPGDPSSSAFWVAAALVVPESELVVDGVLLNPSRLGWVEALRAMGATIEVQSASESAGEPVGALAVRHGRLHGTHVTEDMVPRLVDEVPVLAVVAATAEGITRFDGLGELRHKESDRLARVAEGLVAIGARAHVEGDSLIVEGTGGAGLRGGAVQTDADHRIAMAFSVAALASDQGVVLDDAACVGISYPDFYRDLARIQGEVP